MSLSYRELAMRIDALSEELFRDDQERWELCKDAAAALAKQAPEQALIEVTRVGEHLTAVLAQREQSRPLPPELPDNSNVHQVLVTDDIVIEACKAWHHSPYRGFSNSGEENAMRAALEAALSVSKGARLLAKEAT
jgi:hypothetical protein